MFSDPQSVTIEAVAVSLPRIRTEGQSSFYADETESVKLSISHQKSNRRIRSMVRLDKRAIVADPLTSENDYENLAVYMVIDRPEVGFTSEDVQSLVLAHQDWLDSTAAGKLYGQQS